MKNVAAASPAEVERAARGYLGDIGDLEPVGRSQLSMLLRNGDVVVVDVRPQAEYAAGHIPAALSIPHGQMAARLAELPSHTPIVAYCRGRFCVMAPEAVRLLRRHGFQASPLEDGLPEWRRAGLPITS